MMQKWASLAVVVANSVVAGCKLSNVFAKVFVFSALQKWHEQFMPESWPGCERSPDAPLLHEYVDDFSL